MLYDIPAIELAEGERDFRIILRVKINGLRKTVSKTGQFILISTFILLLIDTYKPGFLDSYIALDYISVIAIVFTVAINILFPSHKKEKTLKVKGSKTLNFAISIAMGLIGGLTILLGLQHLGFLAVIISIASTLLLITLSWHC